jgi:hypothetical protein
MQNIMRANAAKRIQGVLKKIKVNALARAAAAKQAMKRKS